MTFRFWWLLVIIGQKHTCGVYIIIVYLQNRKPSNQTNNSVIACIAKWHQYVYLMGHDRLCCGNHQKVRKTPKTRSFTILKRFMISFNSLSKYRLGYGDRSTTSSLWWPLLYYSIYKAFSLLYNYCSLYLNHILCHFSAEIPRDAVVNQ